MSNQNSHPRRYDNTPLPTNIPEQSRQWPRPPPTSTTQSRLPVPTHASLARLRNSTLVLGPPPFPPPSGPPPRAPTRPGTPRDAPTSPGTRSPERINANHFPPPPKQAAKPRTYLYDDSASGGPEYIGCQPFFDRFPLPPRSPAHLEIKRSQSNGTKAPPTPSRQQEYSVPVLSLPRPQSKPTPNHQSSSQQASGSRMAHAHSPASNTSPSPNFLRPHPPRPTSLGNSFGLSYAPRTTLNGVYSRRSLGPPPSSRKGPASYYPQIAPVHPIAEEAESVRGSIQEVDAGDQIRASYASSCVLPPFLAGEFPLVSCTPKPAISWESENANDKSSIDPTTTENGSSKGLELDAVIRPLSTIQKSGPRVVDYTSGDDSSSDYGDAGTNSSEELHNISRPSSLSSLSRLNPRAESVPSSLEMGTAMSPTSLRAADESFAAKHFSPRINIESSDEADTRGSLTSISGLITRATRLASNLDRGRTASIQSLSRLDGVDGSGEKTNARSAYFSLNGLGQSNGDRTHGRDNIPKRASHLRHSVLPSESDDTEDVPMPQRRFCAMTPRSVLFVLLLLLILIVAAIIIPIVLVASRGHQHSDGMTEAVANCKTHLNCQNNGINVLTSTGDCRCLCVDGFAGLTCTAPSLASCTTMAIGLTSNITVGTSIPKLLAGAGSEFAVPLHGPTLLAEFNNADLNCNSENALVTFGEVAKRDLFAPTPTIGRCQGGTTLSDAAAATSDGIVFQSRLSSAALPSSLSSLHTPRTIDFARTAVLYILQTSGQLPVAAQAQERLQDALFPSHCKTLAGVLVDPRNVDLGNSVSCDLETWSLRLANGTALGGRGSGR